MSEKWFRPSLPRDRHLRMAVRALAKPANIQHRRNRLHPPRSLRGPAVLASSRPPLCRALTRLRPSPISTTHRRKKFDRRERELRNQLRSLLRILEDLNQKGRLLVALLLTFGKAPSLFAPEAVIVGRTALALKNNPTIQAVFVFSRFARWGQRGGRSAKRKRFYRSWPAPRESACHLHVKEALAPFFWFRRCLWDHRESGGRSRDLQCEQARGAAARVRRASSGFRS